MFFLFLGREYHHFWEKENHQQEIQELQNSFLLILDNIRLQQKPYPTKMFLYEKLNRGLLLNPRRSPVSGWTLSSHGKAQKHSFTFFSGLFLFNTKIWLLSVVPILLFSPVWVSLIKSHWIPYELLHWWSQHGLLSLWSISIFMCLFLLFPRLIFFSRLDECAQWKKKKLAVPLTGVGAVLSRYPNCQIF